MKKARLLFIAVFSTSMVLSQNVTIPDANFKNCLLGNPEINLNNDTEIQVSEAVAFNDSLFCVGLGITDLTGIEAFVNLRYLSCVNNNLTSIDISQNTALEGLICAMNGITNLDLSNNASLTNLRCAYNPLTSLDLSVVPGLQYLYTENASLTSLDLSNNPDLIQLVCSNNQISSLDLSSNTHLLKIECMNNNMSSLDITECTELQELRCYVNALGTLDLSNNTQLTWLECFMNYLTTIDVSNCIQLIRFDCAFNDVTALDLSHNSQLHTIYCFSNQLSSLNVSNGNNPEIVRLWADNNPNLTCVQVDNVSYSNANWVGNEFGFDPGVSFSTHCVTALDEQQQLTASVYPNPTAGIATIELPEPADFQLFTVAGKAVLEGNLKSGTNALSLHDVPTGLYFLRFTTSDGKTGSVKVEKE